MRGSVEVRRDGLITIPIAIRKYMKLEVGDIVEIDVYKIKGIENEK